MMSGIEDLRQLDTERREKIAKSAVWTSMGREAVEASFRDRAASLAIRFGAVRSTFGTIAGILSTVPEGSDRLIRLGQDEDGTAYSSRLDHKSWTDLLVYFAEEPDSPGTYHDLGHEFITGVFAPQHAGGVDLRIDQGRAYFRGGFLGHEIPDRVLSFAETGMARYESHAQMLWSAVNNPSLNPALAASAAELQQA